jgi:hypothetical protein
LQRDEPRVAEGVLCEPRTFACLHLATRELALPRILRGVNVTFADAFAAFVEKYSADYRLKSSTAQLLRQRQRRVTWTRSHTNVDSA